MMGETIQPVDDGQLELDRILRGLLQQALTAGDFNRAVLSVVSATSRELRGRLGAGQTSEDFVAGFCFPLGPSGGSLGVAASRGQELMLAMSWELMPQERRLLQSHYAGVLLMMPLVAGGRTIGALYLDTPLVVPTADDALTRVRQVRDAILQVLTRQNMAA